MRRQYKQQLSKARRRGLDRQRTNMDEYSTGWNLFASGSDLSACTNIAQKRGWQAALRDYANATCNTEYRN